MQHRGNPGLRATLRSLIPAGALSIGILASATAAHAEPTVAQLERQISDKSHDLELVVEQFNKVNEQRQATQAEITNLQQILPTLEQRATQAQGRISGIAHTAYQTGGINGLSALLGGSDGKALLARMGTLSQMAQAQQEQIAAAHDATAKHEAARQALEQRQTDEQARAQILDNQRQGIEAELAKLNDLKLRARGTATNRTGAYTGVIPQISGAAGVAVAFAYQAIGTPYAWGGTGPGGYDCSGLTQAAWAAAGVNLAHFTGTQWAQTARIRRSDLQPGDLVFYAGLGHVALYVGNGQVIHAPTFGENVKLSNVDIMAPYGYGRVG